MGDNETIASNILLKDDSSVPFKRSKVPNKLTQTAMSTIVKITLSPSS